MLKKFLLILFKCDPTRVAGQLWRRPDAVKEEKHGDGWTYGRSHSSLPGANKREAPQILNVKKPCEATAAVITEHELIDYRVRPLAGDGVGVVSGNA